MTGAQALSFAIIGGAVVGFASGRFRFDVVALVALLVGMVTGIVPFKEAFSGFTSDVVIIIAAALVISAAVARSGIVELAIAPLLPRLDTVQRQVPALAGATALLSMLTKNVGALAILMPTAIRLGREPNSSASALLMPMAFMSLLGGLVTLAGTSTNIIVSQVRAETVGKPFQFFDFAPVGLCLTAVGLVVVSFAWRLLPRDRTPKTTLGETTAAKAYATEALVPDDWPETPRTIAELDAARDGVTVVALIAADGKRAPASDDSPFGPAMILVLEGDDAALSRLYARMPLKAVREAAVIETADAHEEVRSIEAVIQPGSLLVGQSAARTALQDRFGVKLLGVGRAGERIVERLRDIKLRAGDMLILQAGETALPAVLDQLDLLPLAERTVALGGRRRRLVPVIILAVAIGLIATKLMPVAPAFFGAAVLMIVAGSLSMREAYASLEPEVLILIGALTPLSEAVRRLGGTELVANTLANGLQGAAPLLVLGALMVTAMACSPFLHNAPTVLVLGPISVGVATSLHLNPDPFLMAVATGAGCDFLTPIGHQCNTLVMGPGGYRFGDYWRLGLPLSIIVIVLGVPLIAYFWPMTS
ncbi:SLC13 family permease [Sphingosinicellaceae bacterium]|nr:SLC13 family permease [Sphingosinicellaceae bacterium]